MNGRYEVELVAAVKDMFNRLSMIDTVRERVKDEITFASIATQCDVSSEDIDVAVESVLDEVPMFDGHAALLADAQDRVITYGTLEMLRVLQDIRLMQQEIVMLLRNKLQ